MQGRAGSFKIDVNRKKILPVITICMLVVTGLFTVFINNQRFVDAQPSYTWSDRGVCINSSGTVGTQSVSIIKSNSSSYYMFYSQSDGSCYAKHSTSANFSWSDASQDIDGGNTVKQGNLGYRCNNSTIVCIFGVPTAGQLLYYTLNESGAAWTAPVNMGVPTMGSNARPGRHVVYFDGYYYMSHTKPTDNKLVVFKWPSSGLPDGYIEEDVISGGGLDVYWFSDLVVYDGLLYCFYSDKDNQNLTFKTKNGNASSWSAPTTLYDFSGSDQGFVYVDYDQGGDVIFIAHGSYAGSGGTCTYVTYNGTSLGSFVNWSNSIFSGVYWVDNYMYLFNRTLNDDINPYYDFEYFTNYTGGGVPGGGDAEISVSCSGLSGPIGGNNTHINFVTTNDSKTNVDSDEWLHVTYDAESGNASITELHILWNATIGGQVASLDNLHMCIWTVAGEPTNLNYNQSSWNYVDQFTTGNSGNITVNSSNWSGAVGSTFDYGESIYFMFRIDSLGSLAIGSYSNSASSHKVYITGQTG